MKQFKDLWEMLTTCIIFPIMRNEFNLAYYHSLFNFTILTITKTETSLI